ncbi:MAG: LysR family transcriptional regulator [Gammaproteobacteria bacterium]|nr:LysR family transcriptional regulator [Gammaproteobacteria bacterium]
MDTQLLAAFIAVAGAASFSQAAEQLHLTQPAISKRIAQLEQLLGARLFDRIGRRVSLTESGARLLPRAERSLREIEETTRAIRDLSGQVSGRLSLATSHHIGLHRLPPVLRAFSQRHPEVNLEIEFMDSEKAHAAVAQGVIEFAVITLAPEGSAPRLEAREIWPDPLSVMVASDHPLAARNHVSIEILSGYPAVLPGVSTYTGQILQQQFQACGARLQISMSTNYLETLRMLVAIGLGWSVLPDSMLTGELVALELEETRMQRSLGYVYHRDRTLSNAAQAFLALLDGAAQRSSSPLQ